MKRSLPVLTVLLAQVLLLFLFISLVNAQGPGEAVPSDEGQPAPLLSSGDETEPPELLSVSSISAVTGTMTTVYFAPEDSDGTATYLTLYNTSTVTETARLQAFSQTGGLIVNLDIPIPALHRVRVVSDSVAASPPPSWQNALFANFTDFSTVARLELPAGVKAQAFMVYNASTGTIDPRLDQGEESLRLSSDPLSIFLPAIER